MLFVVFGADCDHVGVIYECSQGTYAMDIGACQLQNLVYRQYILYSGDQGKGVYQ